MTVNGRLVREWRLLWREPGAWVLCGLLVVALAGAVANGLHSERKAALAVAALAEQDAERLAAASGRARQLDAGYGSVSPFRDPRNADVVGRRLAVQHLVMPSGVLAPLSVGQRDLVPAAHPVSLESLDRLLAEGELTPPRRLATGRFDVSFVVVFLAPLVLIALVAATPAWEREQGLLRLLMVQRGHLGDWLAGRYLLRLGVVALPILVAGLLTAGAGVLDAGTALRFATWSALVMAYLGFWLCLAWWVGTLPFDSLRASLTLAALWLLLVVVLPASISVAVETVQPLPSRLDYVDAMRDATERARAEGSGVLARYLEDHPEMAGADIDPADFFAQRFAVQARVEAELAPLSRAFEARRAARRANVAWLRFLSPALLATDGLADAAGTGEGRHGHFLAQVRHHHEAWRQFFQPHILSGEPFLAHDAVPTFRYDEEPASTWLRRAGSALAGLLCASLVLCAIAARRRLPV